MLLNNCAKTEDGVSLDRMRGEVAAMLRVCFEGSVEENGDCLRLVLPRGRRLTFSSGKRKFSGNGFFSI